MRNYLYWNFKAKAAASNVHGDVVENVGYGNFIESFFPSFFFFFNFIFHRPIQPHADA